MCHEWMNQGHRKISWSNHQSNDCKKDIPIFIACSSTIHVIIMGKYFKTLKNEQTLHGLRPKTDVLLD